MININLSEEDEIRFVNVIANTLPELEIEDAVKLEGETRKYFIIRIE